MRKIAYLLLFAPMLALGQIQTFNATNIFNREATFKTNVYLHDALTTPLSSRLTNVVNVNSITFQQSPAGSIGVGELQWNPDKNTLSLGMTPTISGDILQHRIEKFRNADVETLLRGDVVYIHGAVGDKGTIKKASNASDATSARTIGIVASDSITVNNEGLVVTHGLMTGMNTAGFNAGDILYLGPSANLINTRPVAPLHGVVVGIAEKINANSGIIRVSVQNGFELSELHDVNINGTTLAQGDLLLRGAGVWSNSNVSALYPTLSSTFVPFSIPAVNGGTVYVGLQNSALGSSLEIKAGGRNDAGGSGGSLNFRAGAPLGGGGTTYGNITFSDYEQILFTGVGGSPKYLSGSIGYDLGLQGGQVSGVGNTSKDLILRGGQSLSGSFEGKVSVQSLLSTEDIKASGTIGDYDDVYMQPDAQNFPFGTLEGYDVLIDGGDAYDADIAIGGNVYLRGGEGIDKFSNVEYGKVYVNDALEVSKAGVVSVTTELSTPSIFVSGPQVSSFFAPIDIGFVGRISDNSGNLILSNKSGRSHIQINDDNTLELKTGTGGNVSMVGKVSISGNLDISGNVITNVQNIFGNGAGLTNVAQHTLIFHHDGHNPAASGGQKYYFEFTPSLAPATATTDRGFEIPENMLIKSVEVINRVGGTLGVGPTDNVKFYLVDLATTTETLLHQQPGASYTTIGDRHDADKTTGLNIPMNANNEFVLMYLNPTWSTAPTTVRHTVIIYMEARQ